MMEERRDSQGAWGAGELSGPHVDEVYDAENQAHAKCIEAILERAGDMLYTGPESSGLSEVMQPYGYSSDYLRGVIAASAIESFISEDGPAVVRLYVETAGAGATVGAIEEYIRKRAMDGLGGEEDVFLDLEREKACIIECLGPKPSA